MSIWDNKNRFSDLLTPESTIRNDGTDCVLNITRPYRYSHVFLFCHNLACMESLERIYEMDADIFVSLKLVCSNLFQNVIDESYYVCLLHTRWHIYFDHHGVNFMFSDQELLFQCLQLTVRSLLCSEKTIWYSLPNEGLLVKCQFSQEPTSF